jgi:four helix bundle protein
MGGLQNQAIALCRRGPPAAGSLALLLSDLGWRDTARLVGERRMIRLSDPLYRALGSISSNLDAGHSRGTGGDRARFYEYTLGSAREGREWYLHVTSWAKPPSSTAGSC